MKLSVKTIAAHQDLLLASLSDRLAPRWQLLLNIASEQAAFKAEDHLIALANVSDHDFSQAFRADGMLQRQLDCRAVCLGLYTRTHKYCVTSAKFVCSTSSHEKTKNRPEIQMKINAKSNA